MQVISIRMTRTAIIVMPSTGGVEITITNPVENKKLHKAFKVGKPRLRKHLNNQT